MGARFGRDARGPLAGLLVAALVSLACAGGGLAEPEAERPGAKPPAASPGPSTTRADSTTSVAEFEQDVADAQAVAERYWAAQFKESGQRFQPIRRIIPYQRDGEVSCGGQALPRNNAVYCSQGTHRATYLVGGGVPPGRRRVRVLPARARVRARQSRCGSASTTASPSSRSCRPTAWPGRTSATRCARSALTLAEGDLDEFREGVAAVGDDPDQPWFAEGAHGTAEQRTDSFFRGYEGSLEACDLG